MCIYPNWSTALEYSKMNNVYFSKWLKMWSNENEIIDLHGSVELLITAGINGQSLFP